MRSQLLIIFFLLTGYLNYPILLFSQGFSPSEQITALQNEYFKWLEIKEKGEWNIFPGDLCLMPGDSSERVENLKKNLILTGDLEYPEFSENFLYNEALIQALKKFQKRHGLREDGIFGFRTLSVMNQLPSERLKKIDYNIGKWNVFNEPDEPYLFVNVPGYSLSIMEGGEERKRYAVIVGRRERQTKIIYSKISHVVLNPTWTVPRSITVNDILPLTRRNKTYFFSTGMRVYEVKNGKKTYVDPDTVQWDKINSKNLSYIFEQRSGYQNALGQVKIMFPNKHAIYLHDTPQKDLFNQHIRAYSSGCVRVQNPLEVVEWLLKPQWSIDALKMKIASGDEEIRIDLKKRIPVIIEYFTVWANSNGEIHYREDIYKKELSEAYYSSELWKE